VKNSLEVGSGFGRRTRRARRKAQSTQRKAKAGRGYTFSTRRPIRRAQDGAPRFWGAGRRERSFASANDAHLSEGEAVAKMGHPVLGNELKQWRRHMASYNPANDDEAVMCGVPGSY
jgi:hypothetical protein